MFISITFTETSIDETNKTQQKSEAQNLCSKCPPFTRTHAFKRLRHSFIAPFSLANAMVATLGSEKPIFRE